MITINGKSLRAHIGYAREFINGSECSKSKKVIERPVHPDDLNTIVYRTKGQRARRNKAYHSNPKCSFLRESNVLKSKLGSCIAGGFNKHC